MRCFLEMLECDNGRLNMHAHAAIVLQWLKARGLCPNVSSDAEIVGIKGYLTQKRVDTKMFAT